MASYFFNVHAFAYVLSAGSFLLSILLSSYYQASFLYLANRSYLMISQLQNNFGNFAQEWAVLKATMENENARVCVCVYKSVKYKEVLPKCNCTCV